MQRKFIQGGHELEYTLERKKVKNHNLRVRTDGSVYISAPAKVTVRTIEAFISSNFARIIAAQEKFAKIRENELKQAAQEFEDGMTVRIFGEDVTVRFENSLKSRVEFNQNEHTLHIFLPEISGENAESAYKKWKTEYCREIFGEIIAELYPKFAPYDVPMPKLRVREMKSRWGSCIPSKESITLNTRLLAYPREIIEYVAVHELCHFMEANHSARFYSRMDKMMPDWRERKKVISKSEA